MQMYYYKFDLKNKLLTFLRLLFVLLIKKRKFAFVKDKKLKVKSLS